MANVFAWNVCMVLLLSGVQSCQIPTFLSVHVPQRMDSEYQITRVANCAFKSMQFTSSDPAFTVTADGYIVAKNDLSLPTSGQTFYIVAQDGTGAQTDIEVRFVVTAKVSQEKDQGVLKRYKRRWSPPPFNIRENEIYIPREIDRIVSDSEANHSVFYTLSGPGVNEHPVNVFSLDPNTAMLTVHKAVDREEFPSFKLLTQVFDKRTQKPTDEPLEISIEVDDENDNAPTFTGTLQYSVQERCNVGTEVGQIIATDRDQKGTDHVKIRYSLLTGLDLFRIHPQTGVISTFTNTLDRETQDKYTVTVQIKDLDGAKDGLFNTGTATILLTDINDNPPTFTQKSYQATCSENESEKLILRIPVDDKDLKGTANWIAKYAITKGNEKGYFRIATDNKTNEGLLYVAKALNYEVTKTVSLEIMARNQVDLTSTTAQWVVVPVQVSVTDVDEGPEFTAPTVRFTVQENTPNGTVIGSYTAVDPETKSSNGISYYKVSDPASWITVDKNTGELRVANTIDRESSFVHNGMYNITMKAVDASSKTGTGMVIIVVDDVNDNKPVIPTSELVVCEKDGELGSVIVAAEDHDQSPNSAPFSFSLPADNDGKWSLIRFNDTATTLKQVKPLHSGLHHVPIEVTDLQGSGGQQVAKVRICQCRNGVCLAKQSAVSFGPLGILTMLLPLLLLLLLLALLVFFCVTKGTGKLPPDDAGISGGTLIASNIEEPGEDVDSSCLVVPEQQTKGSVHEVKTQPAWPVDAGFGGQAINESEFQRQQNIQASDARDYYAGQYELQQVEPPGFSRVNSSYYSKYQGQNSALHHTWQTNGRYLHQKLAFLGNEEDGRYADDIAHAYGFEGVGSAAGSVGCCSDYADNENLEFLNTLGPKFRPLADACKKT
ncbi:uncharacterized protein V6R79_015682 [Siganus canaliculatus]